MFSLFLSLMLMVAPAQQATTRDAAADSLRQHSDSIRSDTLHEVTVRAGRILDITKFNLNGTMKLPGIVAPPNLGDVLEKLSPGLNDKITHPFAIRQRRKERRHKRAMKALENLDRVRTFDELLREAYEQQMLEDSLEAVRKGQEIGQEP